jgi:hypothetical protein
MPVITKATSLADLQGILDLQQQNLPSNISAAEALEQGFVTVIHDIKILKSMNDAAAHTIAKDGDKVVGYCLSMLQDFRYKIPVLEPMFDMIDELEWRGKSFKDIPYFVMGQTCVAKDYRGIGLFDALYQGLKTNFNTNFEVVVTEISIRNQRSWRAHQRVGFELILQYDAPDGETWLIVAWDLRK